MRTSIAGHTLSSTPGHNLICAQTAFYRPRCPDKPTPMNPRGETDGTPMCALAGMAKSKAQRPVHCGRRFGGTALPENVDRPRSLARKRIAGAIACQSKRICRQGNSAIGDLSRSSLPVGMPPIAWLFAPGRMMLPKSPRRSTRRTGGGANSEDGIIGRISSKRMYAPSSNHALRHHLVSGIISVAFSQGRDMHVLHFDCSPVQPFRPKAESLAQSM